MKIIHFIKCWLATLLFSTLVVVIISSDIAISLLYLFFAAVASIPFAILICVLGYYWGKSKITKWDYHRNIFISHFLLSGLTWLCFSMFGGLSGSETSQLLIIIGGCFAFDSILIHFNINRHFGKYSKEYKKAVNPELLDDL